MSTTPRTSDELRTSIDREGQGDKVDFPDPAAAPLGTDDEAADTPPTSEQLAMSARGGGLKPQAPSRNVGVVAYVIVAAIILISFVLITTLAG